MPSSVCIEGEVFCKDHVYTWAWGEECKSWGMEHGECKAPDWVKKLILRNRSRVMAEMAAMSMAAKLPRCEADWRAIQHATDDFHVDCREIG